MTARFFDHVSEPCPLPEGARIEMIGTMPSDPDPIPVGSRGTVIGGNGAQLWVDWDNGRSLAVLVREDPWRRVTETEEPPADG